MSIYRKRDYGFPFPNYCPTNIQPYFLVKKPKDKKNCKNLFKVKKIHSRQRLLQFILLTLSRLSRIAYSQHVNELPNWDKSHKIFKQIKLVTSKAEEKFKNFAFITLAAFMRTWEESFSDKKSNKKYKLKLFELIFH